MSDEPGTYKVTLTVTSPAGSATDSADVSFVAEDPSPPPDADYEWWRQKFIESRRTALAQVQEAAKKWQGVLATLLGLFGSVAFIAAPKEIDKLSAGRAGAAIVFSIAAFGLALAALLYSSSSSSGTPERKEGQDGRRFKENTLAEYNRAYRYLRNAQLLSLLAILAIFTGTLIVWSGAIAKPRSTPAALAMVRTDKGVFCGSLTSITTPSGQKKFELDGAAIDGTIQEVVLVTACPSTTTTTQSWFDANTAALTGAGIALIGIAGAVLGWILARGSWWAWSFAVVGLIVAFLLVGRSTLDMDAALKWTYAVAGLVGLYGAMVGRYVWRRIVANL